MTTDEVHTYHLNVGQGDCTLLCWVTVSATKEKTLKRLVLIDGGPTIGEKYGSSADRRHPIGVFISELKELYTTDSNTDPKLDAIVITHWDTDHWNGIRDLFRGDLDEQLAKDASKIPTQLNILKYDADGKPATVIYLPYINSGASPTEFKQKIPDCFVPDAINKTLTFKTSLFAKPDSPKRINTRTFSAVCCKLRHDWQQTLGCNLFLNERPKSCMFDEKQPEKTAPFETLAALTAAHRSGDANDMGGDGKLIGVQIGQPALIIVRCHRSGYGQVLRTQVSSVDQLHQDGVGFETSGTYIDTTGGAWGFESCTSSASPNTVEAPALSFVADRKWPSFVCTFPGIGTLSKVISWMADRGIISGSRHRRMVVPDIVNTNVIASAKNSASICCVLVWKRSDAEVRLSHYLAGDVTYDQETMIAGFLVAQAGSQEPLKVEIDCLKLSHHGAINSTPYSLFDSLIPRTVIIPAGYETSYHHPAFELLAWVQAWTNQHNASLTDSPNIRQQFLYSMITPFYLQKGILGQIYPLNKKMNVKRFDTKKGRTGVALYQSEMTHRWNQGRNKGSDIIVTYNDVFKSPAQIDKSDQAKRDWICKETQEIWAQLGAEACTSYGTSSSPFAPSRFTPSDTRGVFGCDFIRVVSTSIQGFQPEVRLPSFPVKDLKTKSPELLGKRSAEEDEPPLDLDSDPSPLKKLKVQSDDGVMDLEATISVSLMDQLKIITLASSSQNEPDDCNTLYGMGDDSDGEETGRTSSSHLANQVTGIVQYLRETLRNMVFSLALRVHPLVFSPFWQAIRVFRILQRSGHKLAARVGLMAEPLPETFVLACQAFKSKPLVGYKIGFGPDYIDDWLTGLPTGFLWLSGPLTAENGACLVDRTRFRKGRDPFLRWCQYFLGADNVTIKKIGSSELAWTEFTITIPISAIIKNAPAEGKNGVRSDEGIWVFSLKKLKDVKIASGIIPDDGYLAQRQSLVLAFDTEKSKAVPLRLSMVLDWLGADKTQYRVRRLIDPAMHVDTEDARNLVWFRSDDKLCTDMRLQFNAKGLIATILEDLNIKAVTVTQEKIVVKRTAHRVQLPGKFVPINKLELILMAKLSIGKDYSSVRDVEMVIEDLDPNYTLTIKPPKIPVKKCLEWISSMFPGTTGLPIESLDSLTGGALDRVFVTLIRVIFDIGAKRIIRLHLDLSIIMSEPVDASDTRPSIIFLVSLNHDFSPPVTTFTGSLAVPYNAILAPKYPIELSPIYEEFRDRISPFSGASHTDLNGLAQKIHVNDLIPGKAPLHFPEGVNPEIAQLRLDITSSGQVNFLCTLTATPPTEDKARPSLTFDRFTLRAYYTRAANKTDIQDYGFQLNTAFWLKGSDPKYAARIGASIGYESGRWSLGASVSDLKMGTLATFFPEEDRDTAMSLLQHLDLKYLGLEYQFGESKGQSSHFLFTGKIGIAFLELDLKFQRPKQSSASNSAATFTHLRTFDEDPASWFFSASLFPCPESGAETDLVTILSSLTGSSDVSTMLPDFANIKIGGSDTGGKSKIDLRVEKVSQSEVSAIVVTVNVVIEGTISLMFSQMKPLSKTQTNGDDSETKRILQISLDALPWPSIPSIPIVGQLQPPFSKLQYLLVMTGKSPGITQAEIDCINSFQDLPAFVVKRQAKSNAIAITRGSHIMIIDESSTSKNPVVLDYAFGQKTPKPAQHRLIASPSDNANRLIYADGGAGDGEDAPSGMAKLQKSQGPLTISNVGLAVKKNNITIRFDARVLLGPIHFSLIGFTISLAFVKGELSLRNLRDISIDCHLQGLSSLINQPPITLGGLFVDLSDRPKLIKYMGGLVVGFVPWKLLAAGAYSEINSSDTPGPDTANTAGRYKSVFIMAQLSGPLIELEFAEITDVTAGLGYNSQLRLPSISEVIEFPFIAVGGAGRDSDPMEAMSNLVKGYDGKKPWIAEAEGPMWIAAGLGVRAFQTIDLKAVVVIESSPYVTVGVYARAAITLPAPAPGNPPNKAVVFVYAELGIASSIDYHAGTMTVQASLMPSSFVLSPSCSLNGGFAMCYWFGDNAHRGDWVVSIGGYHPAFPKPDHYPSLERLSIFWNVGDGVAINGQAYFAITPKMCMAGVQINATLQAGSLSAYFHALADFLVVFDPFYFTGNISISVGVKYSHRIWFVTINIAVDIGAGLTLWGPPFGGTVYVDFWVFGFTIGWGAEKLPIPGIDIDRFYQLLLQQPGEAKSGLTVAVPEGDKTVPKRPHTITANSGLVEASGREARTDSVPDQPWNVRSQGFSFTIQTKFAISTAEVTNDSPHPLEKLAISNSPGSGRSSQPRSSSVFSPFNSFYAKPMHLRAIEEEKIISEVTISVKTKQGNIKSGFTMSPVTKAVPAAIWGGYDPNKDPALGSRAGLDPNEPLTLDLVMALDCFAPPALYADDKILPYDANAAMSSDVFDGDHEKPALPAELDFDDPQLKPDPQSQDSTVTREEAVKALKNAWDPPSKQGTLDQVVSIWSDIMDWDTETKQGIGQPDHMIGRISEIFLAIPLVSFS